jgi:HEPN domain-containing protein
MPGKEEASNTSSSQFDAQSVADYWLTEAEESLRVAEHLVEKADYSYALFFGHLAIEKLLKALYALRLKGHAPPIHNLLRLARAGSGTGPSSDRRLNSNIRLQYRGSVSRREARFPAHVYA